MPSLFQWPFRRKQYPGIGNPRFVSDIVAANEAVIDAMKALTGLSAIDFAIITGFDYTAGAPGTYSAGIFYLNGNFYFVGNSFSEGLYLMPNPTDTMAQPFSDGVSREIYTLLNGMTTANAAGASPIFNGNMNQHRIGLKNINNSLLSLQALFATLGNAAFRNVGTTGGTVAPGDDPRFGYTKAQIDQLFALKSNVLQLDNTANYTPTQAFHPVTKQYADQAMGFKLLWIGIISADGSVVSKRGPTGSTTNITASRFGTGQYQISHNIGGTNYFVTGIGYQNGFSSPRSIVNQLNNSFELWVSDDGSGNDATTQIEIFQYY
jgi:hypothetical protein